MVYFSKTGNVSRFIQKVGIVKVLRIQGGFELVKEKFVIITPTTGLGDLPSEVDMFLSNNSNNAVGAVVSGNKNFGETYCGSAYKIREKYNLPILMTFELSGTLQDISNFKNLFDSL